MQFYDYKTQPVNGNQVIDTSKTGMSFYDQFLTDKELDYLHNHKNLKGDIVMMSPEEYYRACAKYGFPNSPVSVDNLKRTRRLSTDVLEHLKEVLLVHKKRFPIPMLNIAEKGQEGLHRMMVVGDLFGWDHKVPVLVVTWYDEDRAKREAEAKHKYDIDYNVEKAIQETCYYTYYSVEEIAQQLQHELFRRFEYRDSIKVPDEIELKETPEGYTFVFEGYEYAIDKDDVELKDEESQLDDIDVDDLELTKDFLKRHFGDDWRETHPHLKDVFGINESVERSDINQMDKYILNSWGADKPGEGCIFIHPNGKFINIYPKLDDHEDLCYWLEESGFGDNPEDPAWFVEEFNYIRCRNSLHLCFVELPITNITRDQLYSLQEWFETRVASDYIDIELPDGQWKRYNLDEYFPEDIVKLIKRYYASGRLYENVRTQVAESNINKIY